MFDRRQCGDAFAKDLDEKRHVLGSDKLFLFRKQEKSKLPEAILYGAVTRLAKTSMTFSSAKNWSASRTRFSLRFLSSVNSTRLRTMRPETISNEICPTEFFAERPA